MSGNESREDFARIAAALRPPADSSEVQYTLGAMMGAGYVAVSQGGEHAFVLPLPPLQGTLVGRRGAGCALLPHRELRFVHGERSWTSPGAALVCTDPELQDAFHVLAIDVARRATPSWSSIVAIVEEWQALLAPRGQVSPEHEIGLWGELWLIQMAVSPDRLLPSWRGPDRDAMDFFFDGVAAEVKTTRHRRIHHVSPGQLDAPVGEHESRLLSIAVATDPTRGATVPELVDGILARVSDPCLALRSIARSGYSPGERSMYTARLAVLAEPEWYATQDVPRVRGVDPGVSQVRYRVALDESKRARGAEAARLWNHFLGCDYGGRGE